MGKLAVCEGKRLEILASFFVKDNLGGAIKDEAGPTPAQCRSTLSTLERPRTSFLILWQSPFRFRIASGKLAPLPGRAGQSKLSHFSLCCDGAEYWGLVSPGNFYGRVR